METQNTDQAQPETTIDDQEHKQPCECEKAANCAARKANIMFTLTVIFYLVVIAACIKFVFKQ